MRLSPKEVDFSKGFTPELDIFRLKSLGDGLTNVLTKVEHPVVLALNGTWGSGKSTFLRMWASEANAESGSLSVVYYDAFEEDYTDDPFASIASKIIGFAESRLTKPESALKDIKANTKSVLKQILPIGTRVFTEVVIRAATAGLVSSDVVNSAIEKVSEGVAEANSKVIDDLINKPNEQRTIIDTFKNSLQALPELLAAGKNAGNVRPLVIVVDDLDRCRPQYALHLLERVKHFMSVPNVHFVFGLNIDQLKASVKAAYGDETDAEAYLRKFLTLIVDFADVRFGENDDRIAKFIEYLWKSYSLPSSYEGDEQVIRIVRHQNLSLRDIERVISQIALMYAFTNQGSIHFLAMSIGLCFMKTLNPNLFKKAKQGTLEYSEAAKFLGLETDFANLVGQSVSQESDHWVIVTTSDPPYEYREGFKHRQNNRTYQQQPNWLKTAVIVVERLSPA